MVYLQRWHGWCHKKLSSILFQACTFQPGHVTGWSSEGVKPHIIVIIIVIIFIIITIIIVIVVVVIIVVVVTTTIIITIIIIIMITTKITII